MMMWSGCGERASSASMAGTKSSATVQHRHPLASSTMFSSGQLSIPQDFRIDPSTPTSPNSLMMQGETPPLGVSPAHAGSGSSCPTPRKPVTIVTGIFAMHCRTSSSCRRPRRRDDAPTAIPGTNDPTRPATRNAPGHPARRVSTDPSAGILACGSLPSRRLPGSLLPVAVVGVRLSTYSCGGSCGLGAELPHASAFPFHPPDRGTVESASSLWLAQPGVKYFPDNHNLW